jgi:hypothetical protein
MAEGLDNGTTHLPTASPSPNCISQLNVVLAGILSVAHCKPPSLMRDQLSASVLCLVW